MIGAGVSVVLALALLVSAKLHRAQLNLSRRLALEANRLTDVRAVLDKISPAWRDTASTEALAVEALVEKPIALSRYEVDVALPNPPHDGAGALAAHLRGLPETFRSELANGVSLDNLIDQLDQLDQLEGYFAADDFDSTLIAIYNWADMRGLVLNIHYET